MPTFKLDAITADAVDIARDAAELTAGDFGVGDHLGVVAEGERVVSHLFACPHPGYVGWHWSVTLVRAARAKEPTVTEVALLPGEGTLLAPQWLPWADRIEASDVTPGTLVPTAPDDPRLEPGYVAEADPLTEGESVQIRAVVSELGLGRERVLSAYGRDDAAERWLAGEGGPDTPTAQHAPAPCSTCGYFVRLRGELGALFGGCANSLSPSDARVVSIDHGCGAHSDVVSQETGGELPDPIWDTIAVDASLFD